MRNFNFIIIFMLIIFGSKEAFMSESYYWYTTKSYNILQEGNKTFLVYKIIDNNGISEVNGEKILLNYNFSGKAILVSELEEEIIISDNKNYYSVSKNQFTLKENGVIKLMPKNEISKIINGIFFYKSGEIKLSDNAYSKTANYKTLKNIPYDFEILENYRHKYLLKTKEKILFYNLSSDKAEYINIDINTAIYQKNSDINESNFLYDNTHFYLINYFDYAEDITEDFKMFNKKDGFLKWVYKTNTFGDIVFEEKENNALWVYIASGIYLKNGKSVYFYPIDAKFISKENTIIEYKGKYYLSGYSAVYNEITDTSEIKDIASFESFYGLYKDKYQFYFSLYKSSGRYKITPLKDVSINAIYYPRVKGLVTDFFDDNKVIKFYSISEKEIKIEKTISHKTDLKFLTVAYIFDDKLLIEGDIIKSYMDYDTASFNYSSVNVLRAHSDKGVLPIKVKYLHHFKDKNGEYVYDTETKEIKKK